MIVDIQGVVKRFGSVTAVSAVDLTVADGELFTLLGPSGCGKTTLLRLLAGFYQPDAGTIRFGDRVVNGLPPYERRIGMVFQNYALWPHMTVADNIGYGLRLRRLSAEQVAERLREGLRKVNLVGFEARYPGQLSGGQQQRVALARALVLNPDILLLDEPLSNLDAKIRIQVRAEIRRLQQQLRITTIYVTHDQEEALSLSDRVAVMRDGHVLQVGPPRELYERPRTRFVADFVGTNNLVSGEVQGAGAGGGGELLVRTALGSLRAIAAGAVTGRCVLAVRPENVAVGAAGADGGNQVAGRVSLVSYLGNTLRYDVETKPGLVLKADIRDPWHHEPLPVGRPVTLSFPPSVTLALSDDA
ncbi:MAG TPA: ABC transporter ATP-binding protein [Candidatus Nitrosotalea sp.]|jgi:ABC-type Fe3+/spermidine/putrescine transport system ATPase subunit|nr:ABC transporter ATP-binding protein [Candidatus Nitrosotalea sp.]